MAFALGPFGSLELDGSNPLGLGALGGQALRIGSPLRFSGGLALGLGQAARRGGAAAADLPADQQAQGRGGQQPEEVVAHE